MKIVHDDHNDRFLALDDDGGEMGRICYEPVSGALKANSTFVEERYRGQGVAAKLVEALAAYAEAGAVKIIPVCPYVAAAFENNPQRFGHLLPDDAARRE